MCCITPERRADSLLPNGCDGEEGVERETEASQDHKFQAGGEDSSSMWAFHFGGYPAFTIFVPYDHDHVPPCPFPSGPQAEQARPERGEGGGGAEDHLEEAMWKAPSAKTGVRNKEWRKGPRPWTAAQRAAREEDEEERATGTGSAETHMASRGMRISGDGELGWA